MSRKIVIEIKAQVTINIDEGVDVDDAICGLIVTEGDDNYEVVDFETKDYKIVDSK